VNADALRLDQLLAQRGLAPSRERAQALILAGRVRVEGTRIDKAGTRVARSASVDVLSDPNPFVSRGGIKLAAALKYFTVAPAGWTVLDVGASTGGFTDCLLQAGAATIVALDVGHGQLDWTLRQDPRVLVVERCNARELNPERLQREAPGWNGHLDLAVVDVSFISLDLILPALATFPVLQRIIALVKPQFEAGRRQVGRGGIVRDPAIHVQVLRTFALQAVSHGWHPRQVISSPVTGAQGNREFLVDLIRDGSAASSAYLATVDAMERNPS
jgi:23S rRNA (cytidine1920-2'-O)/16S rRNA (cytidine1409-2'-O)-methyltransferase